CSTTTLTTSQHKTDLMTALRKRRARLVFLSMPLTAERDLTLTVNEIYQSIQGESSWAGWRCVFVRLTFCDLRCSYCDTEYAFYEGSKQTLSEIVSAVESFDCPLVEITGGEPLLQKNVLPLMATLC